MNRRRVLSICAGLSLGTAGCLESVRDPGTPSIAVSAPRIEQGGRSTVTAEATNIETLSFESESVGSNTGIQMKFGQSDYSAPPDAIEDSFPPTLNWSAPTDVRLEIPVAVTGDYPPGAYRYAVSVSNDSVLYGSGSDEMEFSISVKEPE